MLVALHGKLEGHLEDTLNLGACVDVGVVGLVVVLILLAEIHAARELANNHEVGTLEQLVLERRLVQKAVEGGHRAHVGKEPQLLAHGKQTLLGAHLGCGVVVETWVANGGKQNGVGIHAGLEGGLGEGIANGINGMGATDCLVERELMAEFLCHYLHHLYTLFHDLRSDSVAGEYCYF